MMDLITVFDTWNDIGCFREILTLSSAGVLVHGERTLQEDRMSSAAAEESRRMGLRICEMESSQRPRERLLEFGPTVLSDAELSAVLLRTGRRGHGAGHHRLPKAGAGRDRDWLATQP